MFARFLFTIQNRTLLHFIFVRYNLLYGIGRAKAAHAADHFNDIKMIKWLRHFSRARTVVRGYT